jgi:SAM-dependent methyltransferase
MDPETQRTYDENAEGLAEFFAGHGSRIHLIERALVAAGKADGTADVLELGCGDGRDAADMIPRVGTYTGIDASIRMIALARENAAQARQTGEAAELRQADMETFDYPKEAFDVVFAYASILHLAPDELQRTLRMVSQTLRPGGILQISSKHADVYFEAVTEDGFGPRKFFFYNADIIADMTSSWADVVDESRELKGSTTWFQVDLRKR